MNIIKASKITEVTKNEIKFYEEQGLIEPEKNKKNGQRNYNDKDIETIILIYALRIFKFNIDTIKKCLDSNDYFYKEIIKKLKDLKDIFIDKQDVIDKINKLNDIDKFKENLKDIICIASELENYEMETDKEYASFKFLNSFPGNYGKFIMLEYGQFLNEKLNNKDKKESFKRILKYIDNLNNFKLSKNINFALESLSYDVLCVLRDEKIKTINNVVNNNEEEIKKLKDNIILFADMAKEDREFRKNFIKNKKKGKTLEQCLREKSYYDNFLIDMRNISSIHSQYISAITKIEKDLGVKYDEDGIIYIIKD